VCRRSLQFLKNKSPATHVDACVDSHEDRGSTPLASISLPSMDIFTEKAIIGQVVQRNQDTDMFAKFIRRLFARCDPPGNENATPLSHAIECSLPGRLALIGRGLRSVVDTPYRRAARSLRHLPKIEYRTVIDAGANRGAFTSAFLELHRPARLVLVEPIPELAKKLRQTFNGRSGISVVAAALAEKNGDADFEINFSKASSSLLRIDPRNTEWFGRNLEIERTIRVPIVTLVQLMADQQLETIDLLKLDLQGGERLALMGGEGVLDRVHVIYTEVFFERLYAGAWLFWDMNDFLSTRGFKLCGLSNIVHAVDGNLLQANATFRRI
jgi:FkbM family methyltransferase